MSEFLDEEEQQPRRQKQKDQRHTQLDDIRVVLSTAAGRRFYWRMLTRCGVFKISYVPGGSVEGSIFNEGERNIGLLLMTELTEAKPEAYLQMMDEARRETP